MSGNQDMRSLLASSERLGVIGSPSSTSELTLDILGGAAMRKLVGELALFQFSQDGRPHYALGQITEVELRNIWHEDPTMRSLIRQRGRVEAVSERQDTHMGRMLVSAVFQQGNGATFEPSILGTVPGTGTPIHIVTDPILDMLLRPYQEQIFYLGRVYGSTPKLPLWFKHFDRGPDGAGEAYHLGIFGKTGSGKSVLAKMILLAYARYPKMALLVVDPQGEFSRDFKGQGGGTGFDLPLRDITRALGKKSFVMTVRNLVLDRWELFAEILFESPFFERLTMPRNENREVACRELTDRMRKKRVRLVDLYLRQSFDAAWELLSDGQVQRVFYRSESSRVRFNEAIQDADPDEFYQIWSEVAELFREDRPRARTVDAALNWLLQLGADHRPILVVDLSREEAKGMFWNDRIQNLVIRRLLEGVVVQAEREYQEGASLNTLVVIDEAHRLAPRETPREDPAAQAVRSTLVDAARTTRKYGLGWMFISQTLSSLHQEVIQQMRIHFFGFGLALGQEFQALRELVGGTGPALDLYKLFRDPHSAFDAASRQYSFMTIGPVSPLSFAGTPLFLNAFNRVDEFLAANRLQQAE